MDVLRRIFELRKQRCWTEYQLSVEADISQSTISSWYSKNILPSIPSLEKICKGFGITLCQFFMESDEIVNLTEKQKELVKEWSFFSTFQREKLLAFIDGMKN